MCVCGELLLNHGGSELALFSIRIVGLKVSSG